MARKSEKTHFLVKRALSDVLKGDAELPHKPLVVNDSGRRQNVRIYGGDKVGNVKQNLVRIEQEADPIGFLIAVQRGDLIPVHQVNEVGEVETAYHTANLADRIVTAKFLAGKLLPTLSVTKHVIDEGENGADKGPMNQPGRPSFAAMVSAAASRARYRDVPTEDVVIPDGRTPDAAAPSGDPDAEQPDGGGVGVVGDASD